MRWPLSLQVLTRILFLLVFTVCAITYANIRSAIQLSRAQEQQRLDRIVELMRTTQFPLTSTILENMKSLSGAEFVFADQASNVLSATDKAPINALPKLFASTDTDLISAKNQSYYCASISKGSTLSGKQLTGHLIVFVQREPDRQVWWQASRSPMLIATVALPIALLVGLALADQVTRPLARLKNQVHQISAGDTRPLPVKRTNDEIKDLAISINEMAIRLEEQEVELRDNERLKTLVQLGSGVAHHLRNSVTGCQMAVELLGSQSQTTDSKNYQVAIRQLGLMTNYIKKFLLLSKSNTATTHIQEPVDLVQVLERIVYLLEPSAKHLNVELDVQVNSDGLPVTINLDDAEQLFTNLLTNAIAAARGADSKSLQEDARVVAKLKQIDEGIEFEVVDNGPGPPHHIAEDLFKPFVTGSTEGTGLGLSLVKEIADRMGGDIRWYRDSDRTVFVFRSIEQPQENISG